MTYNTYRVWGKFGPFGGIAENRTIPGASRLALRISPNPARNLARISCSLPVAGRFSLKLYDATGRQVRTLATGPSPAGTMNHELRTADLPRGIYLLKLNCGNETSVQKVVLE